MSSGHLLLLCAKRAATTKIDLFAYLRSWSGVLPKNAESLRDSDALMRVAVPQASRPRWAAWSFLLLSKLRPVRPIPDTSFGFPDAPACAVPVQTLSQLVPFRLGAVQGFSVLSLRLTSFFENGDKKGRHLFAHYDQSTVWFSVFSFCVQFGKL